MPRKPRLTAREVIQILLANGFVKENQTGSHLKLLNPKTRRIAIVPVHPGETLSIGLLKSIEKQSGIKF
jgi:predicted RNA binding protein YcfA (HicA-like mRNA interferase family)